MPRYWVKRATGEVIGEILAQNPVPHSDWLMIDVPSLPGPIETVRWDGGSMVVDTTRTEIKRTSLRKDVWAKLEKPYSVSTGGKDYTLNPPQMRALALMEPRARKAVDANDATWTLIMKADDGTYTSFAAVDVLDLCERVGNRMRNRWNNILAKEQALDSATPADLGTFDPDVN